MDEVGRRRLPFRCEGNAVVTEGSACCLLSCPTGLGWKRCSRVLFGALVGWFWFCSGGFLLLLSGLIAFVCVCVGVTFLLNIDSGCDASL